MATVHSTAVVNWGIKNLYNTSEPVYFQLCDPATGDPYTGGVLGTNVKVKVFLPTGATHDKDANSPPALTLNSVGNGMYLMALWGEGQSANDHDLDLAIVGTYSVKIYPTAAEFAVQTATYEVLGNIDCKAAFTYVTGTSGSDQIAGCISIFRWRNRNHLFSPLTATNRPAGQGAQVIENLTLKITDKDAASNIISLTASDFTENTFDGNLYFQKDITGITGSRVLNARVEFNYHALPGESPFFVTNRFTFDFPLPSRFSA